MKIEKINDRQIRCTLSKKDLTDRELRLSELAYGSDKAKALFREMMQQAYNEFGFEAEDIPLMIEAVPVSSDCLVLVVTKVDNPEELDTRFSKFTDGVYTDDDDADYELSRDDYIEDPPNLPDNLNNMAKESLLNCFGQISDLIEKVAKQTGKSFIPLNAAISTASPDSNVVPAPAKQPSGSNNTNNTPNRRSLPEYRMYRFDSLDLLTKACGYIDPFFSGHSAIYKMTKQSVYFLLVYSDCDESCYDRLCSILSEFGRPQRCAYASVAFMNEHMDLILDNDAVRTMAKL